MKDWKKILATIDLFFVFASLLILGKLAIIGQHQLTQPGLELPSQYISAMSMALGILAIPICGISWLLFWEMRSKKKYLVIPPCLVTGANLAYWLISCGISFLKLVWMH